MHLLSKDSSNTVSNFDSVEELLPNYEHDYRKVLKEYQRKQLEVKGQPQAYDQLPEASELTAVTEAADSTDVLVQSSAGFQSTDSVTKDGINRILRVWNNCIFIFKLIFLCDSGDILIYVVYVIN